MFDNLVESSSHKEDLARKGSFIGGTILIYAVVLTALFIGSIFWYDAQLENQNLELVTLVAPVPIEEKQPDKPQAAPKQQAASQEREVTTVRELTTERPEAAPKEIKVTTNQSPPDVAGAVKGNRDYIAPGGPTLPNAGPGTGTGGGGGGAPVVDEPPPPPPAPAATPKPVPKAPISGGVLNGRAISLPKPAYPPVAKAARQTGTVTVQVTIDENGNVISARAVGGPPLLLQAATQAAYGAKFSPTKLSGQPVKVTGVITYNFQL
ncbi:MAG: TonB family protein [Pyrinomonadaceae bacterium]|nr:TonB family protein [Pyrinomonadaceae bacterium]